MKWKQRKSGRKYRTKKNFGASNGKVSRAQQEHGIAKILALIARVK